MIDQDPVDRRPQKQTARTAKTHARNPFDLPFEVAIHKRSHQIRVGDLPAKNGVEFRILQTLSPAECALKVREEISSCFMLSPAARKLLEVLEPQAAAGETLARLDLAECQRRLGVHAPSKSTFHRGLSELLAKKIIAKSEIDRCFHWAPVFGVRNAKGQFIFSVANVIEMRQEAPGTVSVSRSSTRMG